MTGRRIPSKSESDPGIKSRNPDSLGVPGKHWLLAGA